MEVFVSSGKKSEVDFVEKLAKAKPLLLAAYKEFPEHPTKIDRFALGWGYSLPSVLMLIVAAWYVSRGMAGGAVLFFVFAACHFLFAVLPKIILLRRMRRDEKEGPRGE
ncbi:hypothetical protein [Nocardiopsis sp. RV163]|uniref:hypothetical protein n=1 Tax=Nocardiopsis sp. RV163 TaxID=1661388 RepID=UPI00128C1F48|nr:hypothetical protein [Nocardiopsis sp. RV163]